MRKPLLLLIITFLSFSFLLQSQNVLPIGSWRTHLPYNAGQYVTQSSSEVYFSTGLSIVVFDKEDPGNQPRFITKTDELTQTSIRLIKYLPERETLLVVYSDGTMDLLEEDATITMPQIKNFPNIIVGKKVNDIFIQSDTSILLAGSFGLSKVRISETVKEFSFTTFTGVNVNSVTEFDGYIYAGTDEGIYRISSDDFFPEIFTNWEYLDTTHGFPADYSVNAMQVFNDKLYLGIDNKLFRWEAEILTAVYEETDDFKLEYLSAEGEFLLFGFQCLGGTCGRGKLFYANTTESINALAPGCAGLPYNAIEDEKGRIWFGDQWRGFRRVNSVQDEFCNTMKINSPWSEKAWDIAIVDNEVWVASGSYSNIYTGFLTRDGFYSFIDGQWTIYNDETQDAMDGRTSVRNDDLLAIVNVAVNTKTGKVYAGSYFEGLIEVDAEGVLTLYDELNSPLQKANGDTLRTRIAGLATDEEGNLWVSNSRAINDKPIAVLKPDGTWQSFATDCNYAYLLDVVVDNNGFKWFILADGQAGILLFDEGEMDDPEDDRCQFFSAGNSNLQNNEVTSLAVDLDGDVWAGTTAGIVIFECGGNSFDDECNGSRRIVVGEDGNAEYLFATQRIAAIAVDGANRKWIGTSNGAYLMSANGEDQLFHFTAENSPLLDNAVLDIACNLETGEVFFATNLGMISYQSDAVSGGTVHKQNITVYPNPVRPDYQGPIAIKGFARDATVKITDISGKLVYETKALGGQVIWDGNDYNGRRANTGVYLVFATTNSRFNFNNPSAAVAKVVLVN